MKQIYCIIIFLSGLVLDTNAQNETDFWIENEKLNKLFLKRSQEIQFLKHNIDSLNGAYINAMIQVLKSEFPNSENIHSNYIYELSQNRTDSAIFLILKNIDLELKYLANTRNPMSGITFTIKNGFNIEVYPIFKMVYNSSICSVNNYIYYFVHKFPVEEIKGELKMKMWLKILEANKSYFNECYNNYFVYSKDREKFEKISEIRKIVNGE